MKLHYLFAALFVLLVVSCVKKKKSEGCEFHQLEFIELKADGGDIKTDKTILECLQLKVDDDFIQIFNKEKSINLKFSVSGENIVEDIDLNLDNELKKSFNSTDEQEMELIKKDTSWEIAIKSDNQSKFNGYIKLFKTSDGDYWEQQRKNKTLSSK